MSPPTTLPHRSPHLHVLLDGTGEDLRARTTAVLLPLLQVPLAPLGRLASGARHRIAREAAASLDALLDVDLCELVATAWARSTAVLEAAHRTAADGSREIVVLQDHVVEVEHRPAVDVLLDGAPVAVLSARLDLELRATTAAAVVQAGRLASLEVGAASALLRVTVAGVEVARHEGELPCALDVALGDGLLLATAPLPVQPSGHPPSAADRRRAPPD